MSAGREAQKFLNIIFCHISAVFQLNQDHISPTLLVFKFRGDEKMKQEEGKKNLAVSHFINFSYLLYKLS